MFESLDTLEACTAHISYWLICHETRNEEGVNVPCLNIFGLFGFQKMTCTSSGGSENKSQMKQVVTACVHIG